jgi:acetyl esterase/lipase
MVPNGHTRRMSDAFRRLLGGTGLRHAETAYGGHPDQVADLILPIDPETPPELSLALVIVVHGGFWRSTYDRNHTAPQCLALARAGYAVAAIEYRRVGGGGGWPVTFTDVADALDAMPGSFGGLVDPHRVVLMGHSAGGHLALWAAGRHRLPCGAPGHLASPPRLSGVIALAAVADLRWAQRHRLGGGASVDLMGVRHDADPDGRYDVADPAGLLPTGARTILLHGVQDDAVPVGCARAYADAARAAGDPVQLRELQGIGHFEFIDPASVAWPAVLAATAELTGR